MDDEYTSMYMNAMETLSGEPTRANNWRNLVAATGPGWINTKRGCHRQANCVTFSTCLEEVHDQVHVGVAGLMGAITTAAQSV